MAQHRSKESRPRQGEILIYKPTEGKGEIYGAKEGRAFRFDLKSSPGLNPDLLRPGIPVTYVTVHSDNGTRAVEVQLEEAGSLETRLRSTRKRLGGKPSRPAGMAAPTAVIPVVADEAPKASGTPEAEDSGEDSTEDAGEDAGEGSGDKDSVGDAATGDSGAESIPASDSDQPGVPPNAVEAAGDELLAAESVVEEPA